MTVAELEIHKNDPRATIADALMAWLTDEQCAYLIDEVLSIDKIVSTTNACPNCNHVWQGKVSVPDAKAVVSALTDLLSQGFGRVGENKANEGEIIFKRLTRMEEDEPRKKPPSRSRSSRKGTV